MRRLVLIPLLLLAASTARGADAPLPPLPQAFSSFGAATAGGYTYVYGGHVGKTHRYSIETDPGQATALTSFSSAQLRRSTG
jgi:hypothetical protein